MADEKLARRAKDLRRRIEPGHHRQKAVRRAVADLGIPVDLDLAHYRSLNRQLVRDGLRVDRDSSVVGGVIVVMLLAAGYLIARYFEAVEPALGMVLALLGCVGLGMPALLVWERLRKRSRRTAYLFLFGYHVVVEVAGVMVVYGEVVGTGPVHSLVGEVSRLSLLYVLVHCLLSYAVVVTFLLFLVPVDAFTSRRRRYRTRATAIAVSVLFRCVELAQDEKSFMDPDTRKQLVAGTRDVALILKHGLWRSMRVKSPLAFGELRRRCVHAGQSVELLCMRLVLPTRTTRQEYLETTLQLIDTLLSGRYGELPDDPERSAYAVRSRLAAVGRVVAPVTVALAPLAVYLLLRHFKLIPPAAEVPVLTLCVAWLATYGLNALGRRHPDSSSQFPNVLGIFGSTK